MASLANSVPLPFLLHSLLASSWTWLALSLATIATLLRALGRLSLCRHRSSALLAPPPSLLSAETKQITAFISDLPLRRSHKRRTSCKSTSSLQVLPFSVGSPEVCARSLRRTASTSKIQSGSFERADAALKSCKPEFAAGAAPRLGFSAISGLENGSEAPSKDLTENGSVSCLSLLARSLDTPTSLSETTPFFETQFGWRQLLDMKLGLQWQVQPRISSIWPAGAVKVWYPHERNLLHALHVNILLVRALAEDIGNGFACIAHDNGDISLWDIANQACLSRVFPDFSSKVSTLYWKRDSRLAVAASCNVVKLWDYRSPTLVPISNGNNDLDGYEFAHCEGNVIGMYQGNDLCLLCDLRKANMDHVMDARAVLPLSGPMLKTATMQSLALWDKLLCDDEESWDEPGWTVSNAPDRSNASFTSRCATLVRSLSSSGCRTAPSAV